MSKKKRKSATKHHDFRHLVKDVTKKSVNTVAPGAKNEEGVHSNKEVMKELKKSVFFIIGFTVALFAIYYLVTKTSVLNPFFDFVGLKGVYR